MSWNINLVGERKAVAAAIEKEQHVPEFIKQVVREYVQAGSGDPVAGQDKTMALHVVSSGHFDHTSGWSNLTALSINPVKLAQI